MPQSGKASEGGAGVADDVLQTYENSEVGGSVLTAWLLLL